MSEFEQRVSDTIEAARKDQQLRPEVLCVAAGFSRASYYNRITNGGWRLDELERIARQLDIPLQELLTGGSSSAWRSVSAGQPINFALAA